MSARNHTTDAARGATLDDRDQSGPVGTGSEIGAPGASGEAVASRKGDGLTVTEEWWIPRAPLSIAWWFVWILAGEQSYRAACYGDPLKDYER